jgi:hypothetical protein
MPKKPDRTHRYTFEFDFTVTSVGIPQPYPDPPKNPRILFRYSTAESDGGNKREVLNVCGNVEGLKYLAAMLLMTADSEQYDPEFHIHLEHMPGVESDCDVTIRAPVYLDILKRREFSEFKGEPIEVPAESPSKRKRKVQKSRFQKPKRRAKR